MKLLVALLFVFSLLFVSSSHPQQQPACSLTAALFFDGSGNPEFFNAAFGKIVVDSQGRLIIAATYYSVSCSFGVCDRKLLSILPNGTLNWVSHSLGGDSFSNGSVLLGPNDRAYFLDRGSISAFEASGNPVPGWPVVLPYVFGTSYQPVVVDQADGTVFARSGVTFSFTGFPVAVQAINPDGTQKWRVDYADGNTGGPGIHQGLSRNLYTSIQGPGLVNLNHISGSQICTADVGSQCVGDIQGTFCLANNYDIVSLDANCTPQVIVPVGNHDG